jgi:hypothetical protein
MILSSLGSKLPLAGFWTIRSLAVRSAKNPKSHPYPSQLGRIRGHEAFERGKCRIIDWFG